MISSLPIIVERATTWYNLQSPTSLIADGDLENVAKLFVELVECLLRCTVTRNTQIGESVQEPETHCCVAEQYYRNQLSKVIWILNEIVEWHKHLCPHSRRRAQLRDTHYD